MHIKCNSRIYIYLEQTEQKFPGHVGLNWSGFWSCLAKQITKIHTLNVFNFEFFDYYFILPTFN